MRLALGFLTLAVFVSSARAQPALTTDRHRGAPEDGIIVSGSGFGGSELIDICFDKADMAVARADSGGAFSILVRVPKSAVPGAHTISAAGRQGRRRAQTGYSVQRTVIIEGK